jgi:hypothetical protein
MDQLEGHRRAFALNGIFAGLMKINFAKAVWLPRHFEPHIFRGANFDQIVIAIVHHVQIGGLIVEFELGKGRGWHLFCFRDVYRGLCVTRFANTAPGIGAEKACLVGEFGFALSGGSAGRIHLMLMLVLVLGGLWRLRSLIAAWSGWRANG